MFTKASDLDEDPETKGKNELAFVGLPMLRPISYLEFRDELHYNIHTTRDQITRLYQVVQELRAAEADECDIFDYLQEIEGDLQQLGRLIRVASTLPLSLPCSSPPLYYDDWLSIVEGASIRQTQKRAASAPRETGFRVDEGGSHKTRKPRWTSGKRSAKHNSGLRTGWGSDDRGKPRSDKNKSLFSITAALGHLCFVSSLKYRK